MIEEYPLKMIPETLAISRERVGCIIQEILDMRKLSSFAELATDTTNVLMAKSAN
jgi:hypothetical protein